jgi:hypothetical protein
MMSQVDDVRPVITECTSRDNVFNNDKAMRMCEQMLKPKQVQVTPTPKKREEEDSDSSYRESSTMGDACRITTEDGAGLDLDIKKLKAITQAVHEKAAERTKKMANSKVLSSERRSKQVVQTKVNTWVETKEDE